MNSRTSRPRSPTSAITLTSALRAARHHAEQRALADAGAREDADALAAAARAAARRSRARRVGSGSRMRGRAERVGRRARRSARRASIAGGGAAVDRAAEPVEHAAEQPVADGRPARARAGGDHASAPGPMPAASPSGISSVLPSRKPTTSACSGGRARCGGRGAGSRTAPPRSPRARGSRRRGRSARRRGRSAGRGRGVRRRCAGGAEVDRAHAGRRDERLVGRRRERLEHARELALEGGVDVARVGLEHARARATGAGRRPPRAGRCRPSPP